MNPEKKSKISNMEWGLLFGAFLMLDIFQIFLEWAVIGLFLNPFIDVFMIPVLPLYLKMRGESIDSKRIGGFVVTFLIKLIPGLDELPLWCLDVAYQFSLSRSKSVIDKIAGTASTRNNVVQMKERQPRVIENPNSENDDLENAA